MKSEVEGSAGAGTGGRGNTDGHTARRLRSLLIASAIAAALALAARGVGTDGPERRQDAPRADLGFRPAGVYSVIAYGVRQREREIGVRLVVGADPRAVTRLFVREGSPLVACGLAAGHVGAAVLGLCCETNCSVSGPLSRAPARRAAVVDPVEVLKAE